jgi:hypothetical protein
MTREETKTILTVLKAGYPNFYKELKAADAEQIINLWSTMFECDSVKVVVEAVKALMSTLKFPPTIADVKEKIALITQPPQMTEIEAWNEVRGAISYYNAKEGFDGLPSVLQRLVGSPNQLRQWAQMESDVVDTVIQSNFMRSYKARVQQEKEYTALPESTKGLIQMLSEGFSMDRKLIGDK